MELCSGLPVCGVVGTDFIRTTWVRAQAATCQPRRLALARSYVILEALRSHSTHAPVRVLHTRRQFDMRYERLHKDALSLSLLRAGWEDAVANWQEIPKGGINRGPNAVRKIWYNPAIVPLWGAIGLASVVCGGFMIKYFAGHTEISWSKTMRATYDHQGLSESRVASHNSHFGMRDLNKRDVNVFPFKFMAMDNIIKNHKVEVE